MPTMKLVRDGSLSGSSMTRESLLIGPFSYSLSYDAPAAGKGVLTTRTDAQSGSVTMDAGYPAVDYSSIYIGLFWNVNGVPGFVCNLYANLPTGQVIPVVNPAGSKYGDALPPAGTPVTVGKGVDIFNAAGIDVRGTILMGYFSGASGPHGVGVFAGGGAPPSAGFGSGAAEGAVKMVDLVNNVANDGSGIVETNPFVSFTDKITYLNVVNGSLAPKTINVGMLLANPYP